MDVIKNRKWNSIILFTFCFLLTLYVFFRGYVLSFTHDECLTFEIIKGDTARAATANNHLLNTWLMGVFNALFGKSEFVLRLPNMLSFLLFVFFSSKMLVKSNRITLTMLGITVLFLNPYLLDFFSLARGYGLSVGLSVAVLYFLLQNNHIEKVRDYAIRVFFALTFALMSAYANLVCLNFVLAIIGVFFLEAMLSAKTQRIFSRKHLIILGAAIAAALLALVPLVIHAFVLRSNHELYFGGNENFVASTLDSLIKGSFYSAQYSSLVLFFIKAIIVLVFVVGTVYSVVKYKNWQSLHKIISLLAIMVTALTLQHFLLGTLYPALRTALIFLPIIAFMFYFAFAELYAKISDAKCKLAIDFFVISIICVPVSVHFFYNVNVDHVNEWSYDAYTKEAMKSIDLHHRLDVNPNQIRTISNTWMLEPSINYYRELYRMDFLEQADRDGIDCTSDYIYCIDAELANNVIFRDYSELSHSQTAKSTLFSKR